MTPHYLVIAKTLGPGGHRGRVAHRYAGVADWDPTKLRTACYVTVPVRRALLSIYRPHDTPPCANCHEPYGRKR